MAEDNHPRSSRRTFFKKAGGAAAGAAALAGLPWRGESAPETTPVGGGITGRMQEELKRALAKKPEERRWAMVIDARRCIGCNACSVACMAENNLPPGVAYRTVPEVETGDYPNVERVFMPTNCMQCEKPPCLDAANKLIPGSMQQRPDGIVEIDYARMKGKPVFEAAKKACPYSALSHDAGRSHTAGTPALQAYERRPAREYGKEWTRLETKDATRKCHFCAQRLDTGLLPACVSTCTGLAMHFGDLGDKESLVAQMVASKTAQRLEASKGTGPRVFYVGDWEKAGPVNRPRIDCNACHSFGA
jgi:molybdopterin-containing oxidoreductase family iron-sulfur binding subunit